MFPLSERACKVYFRRRMRRKTKIYQSWARFHMHDILLVYNTLLYLQALQIFNSRATTNNKVPTVNLNVSDPILVVPYAPENPNGHNYITSTMNRIDEILSNVGLSNDGLGPYWSPLERVVHYFHMLVRHLIQPFF